MSEEIVASGYAMHKGRLIPDGSGETAYQIVRLEGHGRPFLVSEPDIDDDRSVGGKVFFNRAYEVTTFDQNTGEVEARPVGDSALVDKISQKWQVEIAP